MVSFWINKSSVAGRGDGFLHLVVPPLPASDRSMRISWRCCPSPSALPFDLRKHRTAIGCELHCRRIQLEEALPGRWAIYTTAAVCTHRRLSLCFPPPGRWPGLRFPLHFVLPLYIQSCRSEEMAFLPASRSKRCVFFFVGFRSKAIIVSATTRRERASAAVKYFAVYFIGVRGKRPASIIWLSFQ